LKQPSRRGFRLWLRRFLWLSLAVSALVVGLVGYAYMLPIVASKDRLFENCEEVPQAEVGLVFGTTDQVGGQENPYFRYRIDAAERLWKAGKLTTIIVSGDNRSRFYNEPEKMKQALIERGVPARRIVCDFAGLRTLDSVVRAREIFGLSSVLFISQGFQNERAIYIAQANGIQASGFNARDVELQIGFRTRIREIGARVVMWLDINLLKTRPTHLGEKIELPH
jgi:SanA protein